MATGQYVKFVLVLLAALVGLSLLIMLTTPSPEPDPALPYRLQPITPTTDGNIPRSQP